MVRDKTTKCEKKEQHEDTQKFSKRGTYLQNSNNKPTRKIIQHSGKEEVSLCFTDNEETYVKLDICTLPGSKFYTAVVRKDVAAEVKTIAVDKSTVKGHLFCLPFFSSETIGGEENGKESL